MKTPRSGNRRNFLLTAGLGGAGVAAAAVAGVRTEDKPVAKVPEASTQTAYRETDHIRKYYKTTKV